VRRTLKGRRKRRWLSDITGDDLERRSEFRLHPYRVPSEDADGQTLVLKALRNEQAGPSRTTDYYDTLVDTHAVVSGLTSRA